MTHRRMCLYLLFCIGVSEYSYTQKDEKIHTSFYESVMAFVDKSEVIKLMWVEVMKHIHA